MPPGTSGEDQKRTNGLMHPRTKGAARCNDVSSLSWRAHVEGWQHPVVGKTGLVKQQGRGLRWRLHWGTGDSFEGLEEQGAELAVCQFITYCPNRSLTCNHRRLRMLNTNYFPNLLTVMDGPVPHSWPTTHKCGMWKGFWEGLSLKHRGRGEYWPGLLPYSQCWLQMQWLGLYQSV